MRETEKQGALRQSGRTSSVGAPEPLSPAEETFRPPPRRGAPSPGPAESGAGRAAAGARPLAGQAPGHVTITGLQALGASAGESGAEVVGNSGLHFPASRARSSTTSWEAYIKWRWRVEGSEQTSI